MRKSRCKRYLSVNSDGPDCISSRASWKSLPGNTARRVMTLYQTGTLSRYFLWPGRLRLTASAHCRFLNLCRCGMGAESVFPAKQRLRYPLSKYNTAEASAYTRSLYCKELTSQLHPLIAYPHSRSKYCHKQKSICPLWGIEPIQFTDWVIIFR
jgi:hypothetical protein